VRPLRTALLLPLLALALAGCGSDAADVPEVPGSPPELTVPHQRGAADLSEEGAEGSATPTPTPTEEGAATPTPAAEGETGSTGETGTADTGAAATPAPAAEDSPATDTAPPAGSAPEQFEQFCQENAGAC